VKIEYATSLWNYSHYSNVGALEEVIPAIREQGYGVEIWSPWVDGTDLIGAAGRARLAPLVAGMLVTWHARGQGLELLKAQVDALSALGGRAIVTHSGHYHADEAQVHAACRELVAYAADAGISVLIENGQYDMIARFLDAAPGVNFCLDIGHAVREGVPLAKYVHDFGDALKHLHVQDVLPPAEQGLPEAAVDHYICGSGSIAAEEWQGLCDGLRRIDFQGVAVFELRPRRPAQTIALSRRFFDETVEDARGTG